MCSKDVKLVPCGKPEKPPFGLSFVQRHGKTSVREVKRWSSGATAGMKKGDVVELYGEAKASGLNVAGLRLYLFQCQAAGQSALLHVSPASSKSRTSTFATPTASKGRMITHREQKTADEKRKKNAEAQARMEALRSEQTEDEKAKQNAEAQARMEALRSEQTKDEKAKQNAEAQARMEALRTEQTEDAKEKEKLAWKARMTDKRGEQTEAEKEKEKLAWKARMTDKRGEQTEAEKAEEKLAWKARMKDKRGGQTPEERRQEKDALAERMKSLRETRTPEERNAAREAEQNLQREKRKNALGAPAQRNAAREKIDAERRSSGLRGRRALPSLPNLQSESQRAQSSSPLSSPVKKRPNLGASASSTSIPQNPLATLGVGNGRLLTSREDLSFTQPGHVRGVLSVNVDDALGAWDMCYSLDHAELHDNVLRQGADIDIPVVDRFMVGLGVELGPGLVEVHGVGDFSLGSVTPPPPDILSLPPTQATLAIAVVRIGATRNSGHFLTLLAFPQEPERPVVCLDTLQEYTLSSHNSPCYLAHIYKVAATLMRRENTMGVQLFFPSPARICQQTASGNSCAAFAAVHAYAAARGLDPSELSARGEGVERTIRQAFHNIVFCSRSTAHPLSFSAMNKLRCRGGNEATCLHCHLPPYHIPTRTLTPMRILYSAAAGPQPHPRPAAPTLQPLPPPRRLFSAPVSSQTGTQALPAANKSTAPKGPRPPPKPAPHSCQLLSRKGVPIAESARCPDCGAVLFRDEAGAATAVTKRWCCGQGEYLVPKLQPYDCEFYKEGESINPEFKEKARLLNNLFSLSALHVSGKIVKPAGGTSFVKILGRTYHTLHDLSWSNDKGPQQSQLVILDGAMRKNVTAAHNISAQLTEEVFSFLQSENALYNEYQRLASYPHEEAVLIFKRTTRATHGPILGDSPHLTDEIAGIIRQGANEERCAQVWKKGEAATRQIHVNDPAYEPLGYPILRPYAEAGWHVELVSATGKRVTRIAYLRQGILREQRYKDLSRLAQEYLVDQYSCVEENRLDWFRKNQHKLRMASRRDLAKLLGEETEVDPGRVYLPSSFTGSPRQMKILYQDAMAIVGRFGPPTVFVTPKGDPIMCARVFKIKCDQAVRDIVNGTTFGSPALYFFVVKEFQKRGLPHAHIVARLMEDIGVECVDEHIRAEIPGEDEPELRAIILRHNVHGPCGDLNPNCPCMVDGKCTKKYPMDPVSDSFVNDRGFLNYRRRCKETVLLKKRGQKDRTITDRDIVPYNVHLSTKYDCHVNAEKAGSTSHSVAYLFDYISKGTDRTLNAVVEEGATVDEVRDYVNSRYLSSCEAIWRICAFNLHDRSPAVKPLGIHLESDDMVVYDPEDPEKALFKTTELSRYLDRPQGQSFDDLTYTDYYELFVESTKATPGAIPHPDGVHFLRPRIVKDLITRIHFVAVSSAELYFFRILLLRFPLRSFAEARVVEGVEYGTYCEAAKARGLITDELEFQEAMEEAQTFMTPSGLRNFFVVILVAQGAPSRLLWDVNREALAADILGQYAHDPDLAFNFALRHIAHTLALHGRTLEDEGLPPCVDDMTEEQREQQRWDVPVLTHFVASWKRLFTSEQRAVVDAILAKFPTAAQVDWGMHVSGLRAEYARRSLERDLQLGPSTPADVFFIDAPGGSGKTLLLRFLAAHLRSKGFPVICTATTGIAALNYQGGLTCHSMFRLPLDLTDPNVISNLSMTSERAALLRTSRLWIIDEVSMMTSIMFECIMRLISDLDMPQRPAIVCSGDYRQCPPVIKYGTKFDVLKASVRFNHTFGSAQILRLTQNIRAQRDKEYSEMVAAVGNGVAPDVRIPDCDVLLTPLPLISSVADMPELIDYVYPEGQNIYKSIGHAILAGTNVAIDDINGLILDRLPGPDIMMLSADRAETDNQVALHMSEDVLAGMTDVGVPPHRLRLKLGAIAMITRNLSFSSRLCNSLKVIIRGTRGTRLLLVEVPTEDGKPGPIVAIPRITFQFQAGGKGFLVLRKQFPVRLAYAQTYNKSQGLTLARVGVDFTSDVFAHGQAYVALSRVRCRGDIRAMVDPSRMHQGIVHIKNIVFLELLNGEAGEPVEEDREPDAIVEIDSDESLEM